MIERDVIFMENTKKIKGARAWVVFVPTIIIILILLMAFVVVTVLINKRSEDDANEAHRITECLKDISSLQSRSSSTVETLSSFVYRPDIKTSPKTFDEHGKPTDWNYILNDDPLNQYYTATTQTQNEQNAVFDRLVEKYRYLKKIYKKFSIDEKKQFREWINKYDIDFLRYINLSDLEFAELLLRDMINHLMINT